MSKRSLLAAIILTLPLGIGSAAASDEGAAPAKDETVADVVCPLIDASARHR